MKSFKLATVTLLVAAAALSTSAFAKDGTYTAQEVGRNGAVKVQVIVKGNKIESVKVLDWFRNASRCRFNSDSIDS